MDVTTTTITTVTTTNTLEEFRSYFEHVKSLRFDDRPDYDYLKRLFRELFFRKGFTYDNLYDWEILNAMSNNINNTQPNNPTGAAAAATGEDVTH
jgi:casein kinase 1/casein kinase I family protein HRR25